MINAHFNDLAFGFNLASPISIVTEKGAMWAFVILAGVAFLALLAFSMFTDIITPAMRAKDGF